ncbi:hypothetical protein LIER_29959 [Lithospermum erythrorhizon]|uniref:Uncharacterized protein n=1 Tax=Lithospermum erythrorhizon TaxID=34254 RepID=A0AAV3RMJ3_LITER
MKWSQAHHQPMLNQNMGGSVALTTNRQRSNFDQRGGGSPKVLSVTIVSDIATPRLGVGRCLESQTTGHRDDKSGGLSRVTHLAVMAQ